MKSLHLNSTNHTNMTSAKMWYNVNVFSNEGLQLYKILLQILMTKMTNHSSVFVSHYVVYCYNQLCLEIQFISKQQATWLAVVSIVKLANGATSAFKDDSKIKNEIQHQHVVSQLLMHNINLTIKVKEFLVPLSQNNKETGCTAKYLEFQYTIETKQNFQSK